MASLRLSLSAPLAAYSIDPRLQHRTTQDSPTKSAVLGMICAAMGLKRGESPPDVTIEVQSFSNADRIQDFHTLRDAACYNGNVNRNIITYRHYLTQFKAEILVVGADQDIEIISNALAKPVWQLYLGRRACVPDEPVLAIK